jgi:hypothetical protein
MLIEKSSIVAINDIVTVKLISGEEIIGRLLDQSTDTITLGKPVMVALQPVDPHQMGLSFMPVLGSVEPDVTLQIAKLTLTIRPVKTNKTITSKYIEMTSGLITPSSGNGLIT